MKVDIDLTDIQFPSKNLLAEVSAVNNSTVNSDCYAIRRNGSTELAIRSAY